jgi:thermitase
MSFKVVVPWLFGALLMGCAQTPSDAENREERSALQIVPIRAGDTPEQYGSRLVAWYPTLDKAIIRLESSAVLRTQNAGATPAEPNENQIQLLETPQAAQALGMPVTGSSMNAWSSGWNAWGSGWMTWGSGQTSVLEIGDNNATWMQIRLASGRAAFHRLGAGVKVAVIDTGIDLQHPAFQGRLVASRDQFDFVDGDFVPQEIPGAAYGHGTSVAGIVVQVAERAQIMPLRVLGSDGAGDSDDVINAINWAVVRGAQIINLSLKTADSPAVALALDHAASKGVLIVTATGNSGNQEVSYPARACGNNGNGRWANMAISVGSVNRHDRRSLFSSYREGQVGMVAPGELIYGPAPDNRVAAWSGTSMAAPMVAGSLALALGQRSYKHVGMVSKTLREKSQNIEQVNPGVYRALGNGRLDLAAFAQGVATLK